MILSLFIILLIISFILIFLGYQTKEGSYYMLGFAFIFILGTSVLLPGQLEIPIGSTTNYTYTISPLDSTTIVLDSTTETPIYSNMDAFLTHFFGFWITMLGIVGFIISMGDIKRGVPK